MSHSNSQVNGPQTGHQIIEMSDIEKAPGYGGGMEEENTEVSGSEKCCSLLIMIISVILIIVTFPFSLCVCLKMVQVISLLKQYNSCHKLCT